MTSRLLIVDAYLQLSKAVDFGWHINKCNHCASTLVIVITMSYTPNPYSKVFQIKNESRGEYHSAPIFSSLSAETFRSEFKKVI